MSTAAHVRDQRAKALPWPWTRPRGNRPLRGRPRRKAMVRGPPKQFGRPDGAHRAHEIRACNVNSRRNA